MTAAEFARVEVSRHAAQRFVERGGAVSEVHAEEAILKLLREARPAKPPARYRLEEADLGARHGKRFPADFYRSGEWLLVVNRRTVKSPPNVLTAIRAKGQERWW